MESLFRLTELEIRVSLNMNVLSGGKIPNVLGLRDVLSNGSTTASKCLSAAPTPPWQNRSSAGGAGRLSDRLSEHRRGDPIVRFEDEPKAKLIKDVQADRRAGRSHPQPAVARLRSSRRWRSARARSISPKSARS
jgi:hypothetical protein